MTPTNLEEFAAYFVNRLSDDENARFALIEAPDAIVPWLASAFRSESDAAKRSAILNVIWQRRDRATIPILSEGLRDVSPRVWKEALDGLVTIGSLDSIAAIESAYSGHSDGEADSRQFREFLDEALVQIRFGSGDNK